MDNNKFITVDAVIPGSVHIENTANGTGLSQHASSEGISAQNTEYVTIQNLTITNLYKRAFGSTDGTRQGIGINASGNNLTIQSNRIYEGDTLIGFNFGPVMTSNLVIRANTLKRMNHGIAIGGHQANNTLVNVSISGNIIDDLDVWDGNAGLHLDGMIIFNEAPDYSGYISNMVIHANLIGPNVGKTTTAAIFLDAYQVPQFRDVKIYNNVFTWRKPYSWSNGAVVGSGTNLLIANNTFVGWINDNGNGSGIAIGSAVSKIYNNLFLHCGTRISNGGYSVASFNAGDFDSDYNVFSKPSAGTGDFCVPSYRLQSYVGWTNGMAADIKRFVDKNSVTNMPLVDANYAPVSGDTVLNRGTNLSLFFATDFAGQSRPALGSWTIGAYQGSVSNLLSPPSGLRLTR